MVRTKSRYSHQYLFFIIILILTLSFLSQYSYSQKAIELKDSTAFYKNAIKGSVFYFWPMVGMSFSVGYERNITKHSEIELVSYYAFLYDMGVKTNIIRVMPAYKYFTISKHKLLSNIWFSGYLSYTYEIDKHENNVRHSYHDFGIGISIGKKVFLSRNRRWFMDFGYGISFDIYDGKNLLRPGCFNWDYRIHRPIIQIGAKF